jgi:hypothetical protein
MPFTIKYHESLPINIDNWKLQNSEDSKYKKYESILEKKSSIVAKITLLSIITFGIYFIVLSCLKTGKQDLANIKANREIHYVASNAVNIPDSITTRTSKVGNRGLNPNQQPLQTSTPLSNTDNTPNLTKEPSQSDSPTSSVVREPHPYPFQPHLPGPNPQFIFPPRVEFSSPANPSDEIVTLYFLEPPEIILQKFNEYRSDPKKVQAFLGNYFLTLHKAKCKIIVQEMSVEELIRYHDLGCFKIERNLELFIEFIDDQKKLESLIEYVLKRDNLNIGIQIQLLIQLCKKQNIDTNVLLEYFLRNLIKFNKIDRFMGNHLAWPTTSINPIEEFNSFYFVFFNSLLGTTNHRLQKKYFNHYLYQFAAARKTGVFDNLDDHKKAIINNILREVRGEEAVKKYGWSNSNNEISIDLNELKFSEHSRKIQGEFLKNQTDLNEFKTYIELAVKEKNIKDLVRILIKLSKKQNMAESLLSIFLSNLIKYKIIDDFMRQHSTWDTKKNSCKTAFTAFYLVVFDKVLNHTNYDAQKVFFENNIVFLITANEAGLSKRLDERKKGILRKFFLERDSEDLAKDILARSSYLSYPRLGSAI